MWHPFRRDGHGFAAARVAAQAGRALGNGKAAKTTHFNALALHQRIAQGFKQCLDSHFGIALRQLDKAGGQFIHKVGSGHGRETVKKEGQNAKGRAGLQLQHLPGPLVQTVR